MSYLISLILLFAFQTKAEETAMLESEIESLIVGCESELLPRPSHEHLQEALVSGQRLVDYWDFIGRQIVERKYVMTNMQRALIGRQPVLFVGPPGTAKTKLVTYALGNIIDKKTGEPSFFTDQMTFETTLSDTHGSLDFKQLMETGRQMRFLDEGIYGHYFSLLDEQFDMRPNAFRNILTALADGHYKGVKGKSWMIVGASNKSIPEVYARFSLYDDSARALVDRYAYVFYVGAELLQQSSNIKIIQRGDQPLPKPPLLYIQDIEILNNLMPHVEIPSHVAHMLSYIDFQLKPMMESKEEQSLSEYLEQTMRGEAPRVPPWKSTKYMSPRTEGRAATILRAIVILDWIKSKAQRELIASLEDLKELSSFYSLNGPSEEEVSILLARTNKETEKSQLSTIQIERQVFQRIFDEGESRFNEALKEMTPVQDLMAKARSWRVMNKTAKDEFRDSVKQQFLRAYAARSILNKSLRTDVTPELIATDSIFEVMQDIVQIIYPDPKELKAKILEWISSSGEQIEPSSDPIEQINAVNANDLKLLSIGENQLQSIQPQDLQMSPDGSFLYSVYGSQIHFLSSKEDYSPIPWENAFDFQPIPVGKKFIYISPTVHYAADYSIKPLSWNGLDNSLYLNGYSTDSPTLFFANDSILYMLTKFGSERHPQKVTINAARSSFVGAPIETNPSTDKWGNGKGPFFSWQGSDGLMYTAKNGYTDIFRFDDQQTTITKFVGFSDRISSYHRDFTFIGRVQDSIFLQSRDQVNIIILMIDPVKSKISQWTFAQPGWVPTWISRLSSESQLRLWSYAQGEGLYLKSSNNSNFLVLSEDELKKIVPDQNTVTKVFEDREGHVLLVVLDHSSNVHVVQIPNESLRR